MHRFTHAQMPLVFIPGFDLIPKLRYPKVTDMVREARMLQTIVHDSIAHMGQPVLLVHKVPGDPFIL